ncbi:MAG TPA: 16S rRNA (cytosine(967)-C(5))-methyltransferase RsmB [Pseudoxanthomonas sp.]
MTGQAGVAVRVLATRVVDAVMHRGRSLKAELTNTLLGIEDVRDRALLEAICFAVLRARTRSDAALAQWMPRPLGPRDNELKALLHVGFAQLVVLELPAHAAVSATVEAVRVLGRPHQDKLVNALLRRAQRDGLPASTPESAWPTWLRGQVRKDWPAQADMLFAESMREAPLWLRINRQRGSREAYRQRLADDGLLAEAPEGMPDALLLREPVAVTTLPGFAQGDVSVQDGAAQRVVDLLDGLSPGARVLDMCAAPGGKSAHTLERDPTRRVLALDVDARRLQRVQETLHRVGLQAELRAADAADPSAWWDGNPFDAVMLDAPCSATGIVRRQPDVLLHRRAEDLDALTRLQTRLLDAAWQVLRPGGRLVYTTCSILRAENAQQVEAFVARHPDATIEPLDDAWGREDAGGRQRLPGERDMDGFFYAVLSKA